MALFIAGLATSPASGFTPAPEVLAEFDGLATYIGTLPAAQLSQGQGKGLLAKLDSARAAYVRGQPCTAVNVLGAYLNETSALRKAKKVAIAEDLHNRGWSLRSTLVQSVPAAERCAGTERVGMPAQVMVQASDTTKVTGTVSFGEAQLWSVTLDGQLFTQVAIPGVPAKVGTLGMPAVPVLGKLVAVPHGAKVTIKVTKARVADVLTLDLLPYQPPVRADAVERPQTSTPPSPVKDTRAYASSQPVPAQKATIIPLGNQRDLQLAWVGLAAGQYEPAKQTLTLFDTFDFEIGFEGGTGGFLHDNSLGEFEPGLVFTDVINVGAIHQFFDPGSLHVYDRGEELLILTHPSLRPAANTLAQWKRTKGILTSVFEVNDGNGPGPDTPEAIRAFIKQRYDERAVRPSYVLLLGDVEYVPIFQVPALYPDFVETDTIPSDYPYALYDDNDLIPDFMVGRLPMQTLDSANVVVNKIIAYESDPPQLDSFYQNVTIASNFQCCVLENPSPGTDQATFIQTSESLLQHLRWKGYTVRRIYNETVDPAYVDTQENPRDPTPRRKPNGSPLPAEIGPGSGFGWDGDTEDIFDAMNAGSFLLMHIDHGQTYGWVNPQLAFSQMYPYATGPLQNGELLPVVFSANCLAGVFDQELFPDGMPPYLWDWERSLPESLLDHPYGGAVAFIGANRVTTSPFNSSLVIGLTDAVWPAEHEDESGWRRLGQIFRSGLIHMYLNHADEPLVIDHLYMYNLLGDPTLEMWTSRPTQLPAAYSLATGTNSLVVAYPMEGATITAFQVASDGSVPVGRADVANGTANLRFVEPPLAGLPLLLSASFPNAVSRSLTPPVEPDQVNLEVGDTSYGCGAPPMDTGSLFQSFTPTANTLAAVELRLRAGGSFPAAGTQTTVRVRSGAPDGPILATSTATVSGPLLPGTVVNVTFTFPVSPPPALNPGQPYVIEWVTPQEGGFVLTWMGSPGDSYSGGTAFGCAGTALADTDLAFATYVYQ